MAALTPRVNPDATVALYGALATHAGVRRPVAVDDPRVACDVLVHDDGSPVRRAGQPRRREPDAQAGAAPGERLADLDGEVALDTVTLGPFGIKILKILAG